MATFDFRRWYAELERKNEAPRDERDVLIEGMFRELSRNLGLPDIDSTGHDGRDEYTLVYDKFRKPGP